MKLLIVNCWNAFHSNNGKANGSYCYVIRTFPVLETYLTYHQIQYSEIQCSDHSAFMCFAWISEQTAIISLHSIKCRECLLRGTNWAFKKDEYIFILKRLKKTWYFSYAAERPQTIYFTPNTSNAKHRPRITLWSLHTLQGILYCCIITSGPPPERTLWWSMLPSLRPTPLTNCYKLLRLGNM
jgi:hypothetical protein